MGCGHPHEHTRPSRQEGDGTTPLTPDEAAQLKPSWIIDRGALNAAEARAIAEVQRNLMKSPPALPAILDDLWLRQLHRRMYGTIWEWAGSYRATERNIGVDPRHITVAVRDLVDVPMQERRQRYYAALRRADRDGNLSELEQYVQA